MSEVRTAAQRIIGLARLKGLSAFGQVSGRNRERRWYFREGGIMIDRDRRLMSPASGLSDAEALDFLSWLP